MRFPEFEGEWDTFEIADVISIKSDKYNPEKSNENLPCVELESLSQETATLLSVFESKKQRSIKNRFYKGNVLFGKLRPYLKKYYLADFDGVCSTEIWVMNSPILGAEFLFSFVQSNKFLNLTKVSFGSKMPRADWDYINISEINFPNSAAERQKIAKFIGLITNRIETQSQIIEDLKTQMEWLIRYYFDSNNYEPVQIQNIIKQITTRNINQEDLIVLSVSNKYGFIKQTEQFEDYEVASDDKSNYKIVQRGDFAYNPARINVGSIGCLTKYEEGIVSPMYIVFRCKRNVLPEFFEYYFKSITFMREMLKRLEGSVRLCLSLENLCDIKIKLPPIEYQKDIALRLNSLAEKIENESKILVKYQQQKKYLLSRMFI